MSLITWSQCKYYGDRWPLPRLIISCVAVASVIGGVEVGLYFALRLASDRDVEWPLTLMAVLAALLLAVGVLRYYWEIYKSRSVEGISFLFVFIDAGGDVVSILALVFASRVDVLGMVIYSVEAFLWAGIAILGLHFRFRVWLSGRLGHKSDDEGSMPPGCTGENGEGDTRIRSCER